MIQDLSCERLSTSSSNSHCTKQTIFRQRLYRIWDFEMKKIAALALGVMVCISLSLNHSAHAQSQKSQWLSMKGLDNFTHQTMAKKFYATKIHCRRDRSKKGGVALRLTYLPIFEASRPFHRWNWFVDLDSKKAERLAGLKRSDRLELRYRMVHSTTFKDPDGQKITCVLAYR